MAFTKILTSREARWIAEEKYKGSRPFFFWYDMVRLALGYPYAYIIGNTPFLSAHIDLSYKPFIPREETAFWVTYAIEKIKNTENNSPLSILDIFSGSGAIGISVAQALPDSVVFFIEKNARFIKQIEKNIKLNKVEENTHIIPYEKSTPGTGHYDYIFANPPYLSKSKKSLIQKSVLLWEPSMALFAPEDGLFYIRTVIENASKALTPNGILFLEHDPWQTDFILKKCAQNGLFAKPFTDQFKNIRMTEIFKQEPS
jgi:release factor glutamine methyltransferase